MSDQLYNIVKHYDSFSTSIVWQDNCQLEHARREMSRLADSWRHDVETVVDHVDDELVITHSDNRIHRFSIEPVNQ